MLPPDRFRRLVREAKATGRLPSLAAGVFSGGELAWSDAVGVADAETGVEATQDTQYAVASITKTFTAASVMQLRDEGKLELDDPLSRHLPAAAQGGPTIRRMLSHLSGLQREPPGEVWETLVFPDEKELLERLGDAEQVLGKSERALVRKEDRRIPQTGEAVPQAIGVPAKNPRVQQRIPEVARQRLIDMKR